MMTALNMKEQKMPTTNQEKEPYISLPALYPIKVTGQIIRKMAKAANTVKTLAAYEIHTILQILIA